MAAQTFSGYEVRNFAIHKPADDKENGLWTVSFNLHDPTPKANATAPCYGKWTDAQGPPLTTYVSDAVRGRGAASDRG
jgi:hypothetical protein